MRVWEREWKWNQVPEEWQWIKEADEKIRGK